MQSTTIAKSVPQTQEPAGRSPFDVWAVGAILAFTVFFGMLGVLIWGLDRGFDALVEGFYMLSAQNPHIYPTFSSFHFLLNKIPPFVANELLRYRIVEIGGRILSACLLAFGFLRWSKPSLGFSLSKQMFVVGMTLVGTLFSLCFFPRTCSYNGLATIFMVACTGLMFFGLAPCAVQSNKGDGSKTKGSDAKGSEAIGAGAIGSTAKGSEAIGTEAIGAGAIGSTAKGSEAIGPEANVAGSAVARFLPAICLILAGFLAGLDVFDKFTSGLGILAMMTVFLFVQKRLKSLAYIVAGAVAAAVVYFGFFQNASDWWRVFIEAVTLEGSSSHKMNDVPLDLAALYQVYAKVFFGAALTWLVFSELLKKAAVPRNIFRLLVGVALTAMLVLGSMQLYISYETFGILLMLGTLFTGVAEPILADVGFGKKNGSINRNSAENGSRGDGSKENGSTENNPGGNASRENGSRENGSGENGSRENGSRGNASREDGSRENGSRENENQVSNPRSGAAAKPFVGKAVVFGMLFMLLLPGLISAGTNTDPIVHMGGSLAPWFLLAGVGLVLCAARFSAPYAVSILSAGFLIYSSVHFVHQGVFARQDSHDLTKCNTPVTGVPLLEGIKLSSRDADSYKDAMQVLQAHGFQKDDPLICLYDDPGLVYAVHATSPGQAWYIYWPERDELNAHYMDQANLSAAKRVFLVTTCKNCFGKELLSSLDKQGFSFKTFERIGQARSTLVGGNRGFYIHKPETALVKP